MRYLRPGSTGAVVLMTDARLIQALHKALYGALVP
jgi:hypothetical protein